MNYKVLIAAVLVAAVVQAETLDPPPVGWAPMGAGGPQNVSARCEMGVDGDLAAAGQPNMSIRCDGDGAGFGGLQQSFESGPYLGKRVRFSGWIQAAGIEDVGEVLGGAGLWIAVPTPERVPMTNRMPERALTGWTSWEYREFVVDIEAGSGPFIVIGFWAQGQGQMWVRDLNFEIVPESVPVTLTPETDTVLGPNLQLD